MAAPSARTLLAAIHDRTRDGARSFTDADAGRVIDMNRWCALSPLALVALSGCDLPRDPEDTTASVRNRNLLIGSLDPRGRPLIAVERAILERLAVRLGAVLVVEHHDPHQLLDRLRAGSIHVLAGGLPESSPFCEHIGTSRPFDITSFDGEVTQRVFGFRRGENEFGLHLDRAIESMR